VSLKTKGRTGKSAGCILNPYSRLTSDLTTNLSNHQAGEQEVWAMCNDMRRFERMAEEKRSRKGEQKIDFVIKEPERIAVTPETKGKHRQI